MGRKRLFALLMTVSLVLSGNVQSVFATEDSNSDQKNIIEVASDETITEDVSEDILIDEVIDKTFVEEEIEEDKYDKAAGFIQPIDGYTLLNSAENFIPYGRDYEISAGDYNAILGAVQGKTNKDVIKDAKSDPWGGSCFGIATSTVLAYNGIINVAQFGDDTVNISSKIRTPGDVSSLVANRYGDIDVSPMESMINFYYLSQMTPYMIGIRFDCSNTDESANIKKIINKMRNANGPVVLRIGVNGGGHAVVAYGLQQIEGGFQFFVYDNSIGNRIEDIFIVQVFNDRYGNYTKSCYDWTSKWGSIMLKSAITVDEIRRNAVLNAPTIVDRGANIEDSGEDDFYLLRTNYTDFTISDGTNSSTVTGGNKVDGSIAVECFGTVIEGSSIYEYKLPVLTGESNYTINKMSGSKDGSYLTYVYSFGVNNTFSFDTVSQSDGEVVFDATGKVNTKKTSGISITSDNLDAPWYTVSLSGNGLVNYEMGTDNDSVTIKSSEDTKVDITAEGDFNTITYKDVAVTSVGVEVYNDNGKCAIRKIGDEKTIVDDDYGYSVVFDSNGGTSVPTLTNVAKDSKITKPEPITREGYEFIGWFKDEECERAWDFDIDTVTEDTVLYAGWSVDESKYVRVDLLFSDKHIQTIVAQKGKPIGKEHAPSGDWYKDPECTQSWDFDVDIPTEKYTMLYQIGEPSKVKFVSSVGTVTPSEMDNVPYASKISAPKITLTDKEKEKYTLIGWYYDEQCLYQYDFDTDKVWEDMTLYARWGEYEPGSKISISIAEEDNISYTGSAIKPKVIVTDQVYIDGNLEQKVLTEGVDYKVSYGNNTNVCDISKAADNKKPYVAIQGIGQYKSSAKLKKYFSIKQADLSLESGDVAVDIPRLYTYNPNNKKPQKVSEKLYYSNGKKISNKLYTVNYYSDETSKTPVEGITGCGTYYVQIEAAKIANNVLSGNSAVYPIVAITADENINNAKVTLNKNIEVSQSINSKKAAIKALISSVKVGTKTYKPSEDYDGFVQKFQVTAVDSDDETIVADNLYKIFKSTGKKTLIIRGVDGSGVQGQVIVNFTVKGTKLNSRKFKFTYGASDAKAITSKEYNGKVLVPTLYTDYIADEDYTVTYYKNKTVINKSEVVDAGNYKMTVTGIGAYDGSISYSFKITQIDLSQYYKDKMCTVDYEQSGIVYGAVNEPTVSVSINGIPRQLTVANEYTCTSKNTSNVYSRKKLANAQLVIKGVGNYKGTISGLTYTMVRKSLSENGVQAVVTGVTKDRDGKVKSVKANIYACDNIQDINKSCQIPSGNCKIDVKNNEDGRCTLTINPKDEYQNYIFTKSVIVNPSDIKSVSDTRKVKIAIKDTSAKYYYNGAAHTPEIELKDDKGNIINAENYIVTYGENIKVGKGTITVTGNPSKGYIGQKTINFVILPKWAQN